MYAALLDTNTIFPSVRRDFLLSLAVEGLYRPLWSAGVLDELHRVTIRVKIRRGDEEAKAVTYADRLIEQIQKNFDDALVEGSDGLIGTYGLPDPADEHVVAAAVVGGAGTIVTENLKDFPRSLVPANLQIQHPTEFAADTVDVGPESAVRALVMVSERRRNPPISPDEVLKILVYRYGMTDVGDILQPYVEQLAN